MNSASATIIPSITISSQVKVAYVERINMLKKQQANLPRLHTVLVQILDNVEEEIKTDAHDEAIYNVRSGGLPFLPEYPSLVPKPLVIRKVTSTPWSIFKEKREDKDGVRCNGIREGNLQHYQENNFRQVGMHKKASTRGPNKICNAAPALGLNGTLEDTLYNVTSPSKYWDAIETGDPLYDRLLEETQHEVGKILTSSQRTPENVRDFWNDVRAQLWPGLDDAWGTPYLMLKWK